MHEAAYALDRSALGLNHYQPNDADALANPRQITHIGIESLSQSIAGMSCTPIIKSATQASSR
jgi:hypothetical protein